MIKAKLVFRDDAGNICPPGHINSLPPAQFYSEWAEGKLWRDVVVTLTDRALVVKGLQDPRSKEFQLVGGETYFAWGELDRYLSLVPRLLYLHDCSDMPGSRLATCLEEDSFRDVAMFAPEVMKAKRATYKNDKLYTTYYDLSADIVHTQDWYDRNPAVVVRDIILELLKKWTVRDNATLLYLLNQSCNLINNVFVATAFTPSVFSSMRDEIARWQIETPHLLATAHALSKMDFDAWDSIAKFTNEPGTLGLHPENAILMGNTHLFCLGSPHDISYPDYGAGQKDLFLCGSPDILGVRSVAAEPSCHLVDHTIIGAPMFGWLWYTYIGTQITNSRAVVAGVLKD